MGGWGGGAATRNTTAYIGGKGSVIGSKNINVN